MIFSDWNLLAVIDPVRQPPGFIDTPWVSIANLNAYLALISVGAFGSGGTVDAKLRQATDDSGSNAKDIDGRAITTLVATGGDSRQAVVNLAYESLDASGAFDHFGLRVTVGGAATYVSAFLFGAGIRYAQLQCCNLNAPSLVEIV